MKKFAGALFPILFAIVTKAEFTPGTAKHWQIQSKFATQYWIKEKPGNNLKGVVNGRYNILFRT